MNAPSHALSRKDRKAIARAWRLDLKLAWTNLSEFHVKGGGTFWEACQLIAKDAEARAKKEPHKQSEIMEALKEWVRAVERTCAAISKSQ